LLNCKRLVEVSVMRKPSIILSACCVCALLISNAVGSELTGFVTNTKGEPIPSVSVVTDVQGVGTMTQGDGKYNLKLPDEVGRVTFSSIGYHARQFSIEAVPVTVVLEERYYRGTDIIVRGDRAQAGISPMAFDNVSREEIERDYTVGEFPLLLSTTTNFFSYSDGGAPLGYSYTNIRGFDDKRITTYINGVPLNDPEDQATYFVDLPDFAANIDDIQVQRGVGNSLYGDASFGGTINVATSSLSRPRYARATFGYGEYSHKGEFISDIYKQSIEYSSGLLDGKWHFTGRFSRQKTGGYRYNSWYNGWAYAFSVGRVDENMTTELYLYGGPMRMHLAYWGASRQDITADRRSNVLEYDNETDNFNQPHYHLHHHWAINDRTTLSNTLYYIRGEGYYEQLKQSSVYAEYGIDTTIADLALVIDTTFDDDTIVAVDTTLETGDLVRQQWVRKNQWGWSPTLVIEHDRGSHTFGGSFYYFESDHWGQVVWAQHIDGSLPPRHRYYQYYGKKWVGSVYSQEIYSFTDKLSTQATTQLRFQRYDFDQEKMSPFLGHQYDLNWLFFSPRLGFSYTIDEHLSIYTNFAVSSRTPTDASVYDANDPSILPSLVIETVNGDSTTYVFGDALVENERVYDFELGGSYRSNRFAAVVNLFWMDFRNEIVPYGGINENTGLLVTVNADRSVHAGIEMASTIKPVHGLTVDGNFAYNYNRVKKYIAVIDGFEIDFNDKTISNAPEYLGNLITDYKWKNWRFTNQIRLVGKRYMELYNIEEHALGAFATSSLSVQYTLGDFFSLGQLILQARVDNIADKKYETSGYGGNYACEDSGEIVVGGWAEYYIAPERSIYGQIQLEMF